MTSFYDHLLHKTYQLRLNSETNIKENILKAIEDWVHLVSDPSTYPSDQISLFNNRFPSAGIHSFPALQITDYIISIQNYREVGDLFTVRFVHPTEKYCEVLFLNPNEDGQVWLLIISPELKDVEEVKKYSYVNLISDTVEAVFY
jgi:hypothetical protein